MSSLYERARAAALKQAEGKERQGSFYNRAYDAGDSETLKIAVTNGQNPRVHLRLVPYVITDPRNNPDAQEGEWYKRRYWVHRVGADGIRVACSRTFGRPCVVCAERRKLRAEGKEDVAKAIGCSERELFNVYDIKEKKVKLLDASTFLFGKKLLAELNDPENEDAFMCVVPTKEGKYLSLRFDPGTLQDTVTLGNVKFIDAKEAIPSDVLKQAIDLDAILIDLPDEELQKLMANTTPYAERNSQKKPQEGGTVATPRSPDAEDAASDPDDLDF